MGQTIAHLRVDNLLPQGDLLLPKGAPTRQHEFVHVRQYERWGPLFIPLYLFWSCWLWCVGKNPYFDNPFEREAYEQAP